jgi:hypothetical protein
VLAVDVFEIHRHTRSKLIAAAMLKGIAAAGDQPVRRLEHEYQQPMHGIGVLYGLEGRAAHIFSDYCRTRMMVFADLGYWGRRQGGRWAGFHKLVVNGRHPNAYFQRRPQRQDRAEALGVKPKPWKRDGGHILLCGMGDKGAQACGFRPEQWERETIATLLKYTDRPILYRPKPSWQGAKPLPGVGYSPRTQSFDDALQGAHCVVSHHSNCNVDGLVEGVPSFCTDGLALPLSLSDLSRIESPIYPDGREQWIADACYTQWSVDEISRGLPWRHLKEQGLIPCA